MRLIFYATALLALALALDGAAEAPGIRADGSILLPNQWLLRPIGAQAPVGCFPVNMAVHPSGLYAAVLHCGFGQHEIVILDLRKPSILSRVAVNEAFYGISFTSDGSRLYCSGGADEVVRAFHFADGFLAPDGPALPLRDVREIGVPAGLAVSADGSNLYVANVLGHSVSWLRPGDPAWKVRTLPLSGAGDPTDAKQAEPTVEIGAPDTSYPYACLLDEARHRLFVSLWGQSAVQVIDTENFALLARWATEEHPNEMALTKDGKRLFVANANRNSVSEIDPLTGRRLETLVAELTPNAEPGNTPNSLALSPDEKRLFVANASINTVAVFDVSQEGKARSAGFIPVGWYPTSVRLTPDGRRLLVANGKGLISKANRNGPRPGSSAPASTTEYIANLLQGTVSIITLPAENRWEAEMAKWSARAFVCMPETERKLKAAHIDGLPFTSKLDGSQAIRYVIYIIKENRTYDQVLGDMGKGNGDASLCLFGENVTPNQHALAGNFVLLDNFYADAEVSAQGHEWSMGAFATDFVEKMWPMNYGHNDRNKYPYPAEGGLPIVTPAGGYLWDRAKQAGVTYRSYGEFVQYGVKAGSGATTNMPGLKGHIDPEFHGWDLAYPDVTRADRFVSELHRFEEAGEMPRLQIMRLPNDHTSGSGIGVPTPTAYVADNDYALGKIVDAVSKSKFWPKTAIFIVEDDAQNGADHVDAHRTIAFVVSPYAKHGAIDSTLYSTTSMLKTIELILGLKPMSQFDAAAMPMFSSFQAAPDFAPYTALMPGINRSALNDRDAWGGKESAKMDFSKEDAADDLRLNEIVWRSVRGAESPMPPPVHAAFMVSRNREAASGKDDD